VDTVSDASSSSSSSSVTPNKKQEKSHLELMKDLSKSNRIPSSRASSYHSGSASQCTVTANNTLLKARRVAIGYEPEDCVDEARVIFEQLYDQEETACAKSYMHKQDDLNYKMRAILIDWLVDVHCSMKLQAASLWLTVAIIDRYLMEAQTERKYLQLVGIAALSLACKTEDIYIPVPRDFVFITDYAYSLTQLMDMELAILKVFNYNVSIPTGYYFLNRYLRAIHATTETRLLAFYYADRNLQEADFLKQPPHFIAASALYAALQQRKEAGEPTSSAFPTREEKDTLQGGSTTTAAANTTTRPAKDDGETVYGSQPVEPVIFPAGAIFYLSRLVGAEEEKLTPIVNFTPSPVVAAATAESNGNESMGGGDHRAISSSSSSSSSGGSGNTSSDTAGNTTPPQPTAAATAAGVVSASTSTSTNTVQQEQQQQLNSTAQKESSDQKQQQKQQEESAAILDEIVEMYFKPDKTKCRIISTGVADISTDSSIGESEQQKEKPLSLWNIPITLPATDPPPLKEHVSARVLHIANVAVNDSRLLQHLLKCTPRLKCHYEYATSLGTKTADLEEDLRLALLVIEDHQQRELLHRDKQVRDDVLTQEVLNLSREIRLGQPEVSAFAEVMIRHVSMIPISNSQRWLNSTNRKYERTKYLSISKLDLPFGISKHPAPIIQSVSPVVTKPAVADSKTNVAVAATTVGSTKMSTRSSTTAAAAAAAAARTSSTASTRSSSAANKSCKAAAAATVTTAATSSGTATTTTTTTSTTTGTKKRTRSTRTAAAAVPVPSSSSSSSSRVPQTRSKTASSASVSTAQSSSSSVRKKRRT